MLQTLTANPEEEVKVFLQPWQLLLLVLAGWVNRQQQDAIEYLLVENRVLRQKHSHYGFIHDVHPPLANGLQPC
jgi:hypothetical protein